MTHLGDRIAAFVDGQLPDDERRVAEHHVASCEECLHKVREQRLLKSRMNSLGDVEAPQHLLASLSDVQRLAAASPPQRPGLVARCLRSTSVRTLVAVTGASVTVTALAYGVGSPVEPTDPEVRPAVEQFAADFESSAPSARRTADPEAVAPAAQTVHTATSPRPPLAAETPRVVGSDDADAVRVLRSAGGSSAYLSQLVRNYRVTLGSRGEVDGRPATEVRVNRGGRVVAGLWVDRDAESVLRRDLYGTDGTVVESLEYLRGPSAGGHGTGDDASSDDGVEIDAETLDALASSGWACDRHLARNLARVRGHWLEVGDGNVARLTYTDGLSRLSLYEQRGRLDPSALDGFTEKRVAGSRVWVRDGSSRVAVWSARGVVYTAVTDAGEPWLRRVVSELPHDRADGAGAFNRVETGLRRMGSWLAPV